MGRNNFVFVYENKNRELENICLLAHELKRRGYTVGMVETWHAANYYVPPLDGDVIVTSACYSNGTLKFQGSHVREMRKVVNLQWEQVFSKTREMDLTGTTAIRDKAKDVIHVSWGQANYDRLVNIYHVPPKNVRITGHLAMDFLRPFLCDYYMNRSEIDKLYPKFAGKKLYLFISSFSVAAIPKEYVNSKLLNNAFSDPQYLQDFQLKSQKTILEWVEKELVKHPEVVFVYRPHPSEVNSQSVLDLQKRLDNFVVIEDYSVQQWILAADKVYTQTSTSIVQVYAAKRGCTIIRPYPMPEEFDMSIYDGCKCITEYDDFSASFETIPTEFPINEELLLHNYYFDDQPVYLKICDLLEETLKDDSYCLESPIHEPKRGFALLKVKFKKCVRRMLGRLYPTKVFGALIKCNKKIAEKASLANHSMLIEKKNYSTPEEIAAIEKKIAQSIKEA